MTTPVGFDLNLDTSNYVQSAGLALTATNSLDQSLAKLAVGAGAMNRAWTQASPPRPAIIAMGAFSAAAADAQAQMSGFQATARITGQSAEKLASGVRQMARDMPISSRALNQTVDMVSQLGIGAVNTKKQLEDLAKAQRAVGSNAPGVNSTQVNAVQSRAASQYGAENRIVAIAKLGTQLGAATGGDTNSLTAGLVQLDRTFNNNNLDPKHLRDVSDALVGVSKSAGVSAQGTLDFAGSIAPMAKAAGIGEKATIGISAAFSQIGQDGQAAGTAVTKIMSDISRAARDGGQQMAVYGSIVGKTADQFSALYKSNPVEALTQVTEAIGKNSTQGPRILESLGLEGIRTQRALTALSGSGQLRDIVGQSLNSGSNAGATQSSANAAFKDIYASFQRTANASQQLAEALGRPLLGPLSVFAAGLQKATGGVAAVAQSRVGRDVLNVAGIAGAAWLVGRRLFGIGQGAALATQIGTSGPVRGLLGGIAVGRAGGDYDLARQSWLGRFGAPMLDAAQQGRLSGDGMQRVNRGFLNTGVGIGRGLGPAGPAGAGIFGMVRNVAGMGFLGAAAYSQTLAAQAQMAREPDPTRRSQIFSRRMGFVFGDAGRALGQANTASYEANLGPNAGPNAGGLRQYVKDVSTNTRDFIQHLNESTSTLGKFGMALRGTAASIVETGRFLGRAGGAGVGLLGKAGSGLVGALGGPWGVGLTAASIGIPMLLAHNNQSSQDRKSEQARQLNMPIDDTFNKYMDSIGKAGDNSMTMAEQLAQATRIISNSVTSFSGPNGALTVSSSDQAVANQSRSSVVQAYDKKATPDQIAAQLRLQAPSTGYTPELLQAQKVDLLRQFPTSFVNQVMTQMAPTVNNPGSPMNPAGPAMPGQNPAQSAQAAAGNFTDIRSAVAHAAGIDVNEAHARDSNKVGVHDYYHHMPGQGYKLKPEAQSLNDQIQQNLADRYSQQSSDFGAGFATQSKYQGINAAMDEAIKHGNEAEVNNLGDQLAQTLPGVDPKKIPRITTDDIKKYHGYIQALQAKSPDFAKAYADQQSSLGLSADPNATPIAAATQQSDTAKLLGRDNTQFGSLFDNTRIGMAPPMGGPSQLPPDAFAADSTARSSVFASLQQPDSVSKKTSAVDDTIAAYAKSGKSMGQLSADADKAANALGGTATAAGQLAMAVSQQAQAQFNREQTANPKGQTPMAQLSDQAKNINDQLAVIPDTPENADKRNALKDQGAQVLGQIRQQLVDRLQLWRNYNTQVSRTQEDFAKQQTYARYDFGVQQTRATDQFHRSQLYAQQDFQRSSSRMTEDFHTSQARGERDFQISVSRTQEDFHTSQYRAERDFNISMTRSYEDYNTSRMRAVRDFTKQIQREVTDQAQALYDPYSRIKTQPVWDANSLVANMGDQNAAIQKQVGQLSQVRKMGLGENAIQSLGLNDPKNAQQLNQLVNDLLTDPSLIKQINQTTAAKLALGGSLVNDPANKAIQRAKQDFQTQLSDMQVDFEKSIARSRADFQKSLSDAAQDNAKNLARMNADYNRTVQDSIADFEKAQKRANEDYTTQLTRSQTEFDISMANAQADFQTQMTRLEDSEQTALKRMREDVNTASADITGSIDQLWSALQDTMQGKSDSINNLMKNGLVDTFNSIQSQQSNWQALYKNLFPYDLSQVFGTGGPGPISMTGQGSSAKDGPKGARGGPDAAHMPDFAPHGGPYAQNANAASQQFWFEDIFAGNRVGGMGSAISPAPPRPRVTQGFGENRSGEANTGGGWPVDNPVITQAFGNKNGHDAGGHPGIDLGVPRGTPIHSPLTGVVVYAGWNDGYGNFTIIDNGGGRSTAFGHQQAIFVHPGQKVSPGQVIGAVDSTGNSTGDHLHFETRMNGMVTNPAAALPFWESTDGLGSFDPGATAAGYGVATMPHLDKNNYIHKQRGPWGALIEMAQAEKDAALQQMAADSANSSMTGNLGSSAAPVGPVQDYARQLLKERGWDGQFDALNNIITRESGWDPTIHNGGGHGYIGPNSAYGIPQALPGDKMAAAGPDWMTSPYTQLRWMMGYIASTYHDPNGAWAFWQGHHAYGTGSIVNGAQHAVVGENGPEAIIPLNNQGVTFLANSISQVIRPDQLHEMVAGDKRSPVTYVSEVTTIDKRNVFEGPITVASNDPNDLVNKLAAKQRASNLVRKKVG